MFLVRMIHDSQIRPACHLEYVSHDKATLRADIGNKWNENTNLNSYIETWVISPHTTAKKENNPSLNLVNIIIYPFRYEIYTNITIIMDG